MALRDSLPHPSGKEIKQQPLYFFNTLGKSLQEFSLPSNVPAVRMYNCGPTVYGRQHIGNHLARSGIKPTVAFCIFNLLYNHTRIYPRVVRNLAERHLQGF